MSRAHPEGPLHREGVDRREKKPEEWTRDLGMPDLCGEVPGEELRCLGMGRIASALEWTADELEGKEVGADWNG